MTVEWYDSRPEAELAEETAIQAGRPKHNERHAAVPLQVCLGLNPQELTRTERVTAGAIARFRIGYPDRARIAESEKCWSCGAQPGELCHTASGKLAYYHQFRWGDFRRRLDAGRTMSAEPDLIGMLGHRRRDSAAGVPPALPASGAAGRPSAAAIKPGDIRSQQSPPGYGGAVVRGRAWPY